MTTHRDLTRPELRPCPWCAPHGSPSSELHPTGYWAVLCGCGSQGPASNTETEAIAAWNRRPRTFTAAEVAEVVAGIANDWQDEAAAMGGPASNYAIGLAHCATEIRSRITHWLRENEG